MKKITAQRVAAALRKYRKQSGSSMAQMARDIGGKCDARSVQLYLRGTTTPGGDRLVKIAVLCGVSLDELVNGGGK